MGFSVGFVFSDATRALQGLCTRRLCAGLIHHQNAPQRNPLVVIYPKDKAASDLQPSESFDARLKVCAAWDGAGSALQA